MENLVNRKENRRKRRRDEPAGVNAEIEIVNSIEIPDPHTDFSAKNARTLAARVPHCHGVRTGDVDRGAFSIGRPCGQ